MASSSPTQDVKHKSKLPQYGQRNSIFSHAGREKPLFTSMRRPQFQQEFTTDSLNNTAAEIPSPAKPLHTLSNGMDRPARGIGLGAAFRRVDGRSKSEKDKEPSSLIDRGGNGRPIRPSLPRHHVTEIASPTPKTALLRARAQTPSPPRERAKDFLLSPMSEVSESSPPREFAEAYKQINDQEDLAALEEELDSGDDTEDIVADGELQLPPQKSSRRNSRRRSPGVDDAIILDMPENGLTKMTQESIPSLPSVPKANASQSSRHQRDLRRLDLALGESKVFSKASRRQKREAPDAQLNYGSSRSGSHSDNSNTSGSILSDVSLNIPSTWGRKARHGKTWLSRLERAAQGETRRDELFKTGDLEPVEAEKNPIYDWQAEASMTPLPPIQDQDSLEQSPSPLPAKSASFTARDKVRKLAFGEDKFLTKTQEDAMARARNPALTLIREREIENLAKSAVTTNRLGELKERRSLERVGSRPASSGLELDQADVVKTGKETFVKPQPLQPLFEAVPIVKSENIDLRDAIDSKTQAGNDIQALEDIPLNHGSNEREHTDMSTPISSRSTKQHTYLKTPLVTGAWIDTPLPAIKAGTLKNKQETDVKRESALEMSGELDTADPIAERKNTLTAPDQQEILKATAPKLPGSALAAIITHAKDKKARGLPHHGEDTLQLDDSTILSLEEFIASGENSDDESLSSDGELPESRNVLRKHRIAASRLDKRISDSVGEVATTTRLNRLRTSIQDAKKDVSSLEKRISRLPDRPATTASSRASSVSRQHSDCEEAGEFHDFIWPCEKCGHKAGSTLWDNNEVSLFDWHWRPIQVYMPKLWFWPSATARLPQPTKLGWWSILCSVLLITEIILSDIYSPPFYASTMSGYGVNIHSPRPPLILPKLIWKHLLSSPFDSIRFVLQVFVRFLASILGVDPGSSAAPEGDAWRSSRRIYSPDRGSDLRGRFDHDVMGMDADEYL